MDWQRLYRTETISITLPTLPFALAFLIPATGYAVHRLTSLPPIKNSQLKISPGLGSVTDTHTKKRLDEIYPENLLGEAMYASLPLGRTKYSVAGPEEGRKVVLIHGFSIPSAIFKDVSAALVAGGFRVLTYDLYGRGYSEAPHLRDPPSHYTTQLALLLQYIGWTKTRVVGLSMGGAIAAAFCDQFPHLVDGNVAFIASAGNFPDNYTPRRLNLLSTVAAQAIASLPFVKNFKKLAEPPRTPLQAMAQLYFIQWQKLPYFGTALASSLRFGPLRGLGNSFKRLGSGHLDILIIHGTADNIVPYDPFMSPILTNYMPRAKVVTLENVGHELTVTHPEEVSNALIEFFDASSSITP